jgi:AhpD family alkylhydroperoxidase
MSHEQDRSTTQSGKLSRDPTKLIDALDAFADAASAFLGDPLLLELVNVHISRRNGCRYCTLTHEASLRELGACSERSSSLDDWRSSAAFSPRERAALEWAEAVSQVESGIPEELRDRMQRLFSATEIAGLTAAVSAIEAWNRLGIGLRLSPPSADGGPSFVSVGEDHVATLLSFVERYYAFDKIPFDRDAVHRGALELVARPDLGGAWLIRDGERFVGYFVLSFGFDLEFGGRQATVTDLFLEADVRGRGLGSEALRFIERTLLERGIHALELQVERDNHHAMAFYQRAGLHEHSRIPMSKRLTTRP